MQRKKLKIPLAQTEVGQNHFILWQINTGMDGDTEVLQQEIKVWEVCEWSRISKVLERVEFLQRGCSDEVVGRCRRQPFTVDGGLVPLRFDGESNPCATLNQPSIDLDIRTVDPDTIALASES